MVPNFALALSFEGITLLRRMGSAWARIEEVPIDHPDLDAAVVAMRDRAEMLDPRGAEVAVLLPNEQIRYLDVPDLANDDAARMATIKQSLDGATPYAVAELSHDHVRSNGQLQIAAVADETLREAEIFARDHGFTPVCHMARAPEGSFDGAVFFGKAEGWRGAVHRPKQAISVVPANEAALTPVTAQAAVPPTPAAETPAKPDVPFAPATSQVETPEQEAPNTETSASEAQTTSDPLVAASPPPVASPAPDMAEPQAIVPAPDASSALPKPQPEPQPAPELAKQAEQAAAQATPEPQDSKAPPAPPMAFASSRAGHGGKAALSPAPKPDLTAPTARKRGPIKARFTPVAAKEMATRDAGITSDHIDEVPEQLKPAAVPLGRAVAARKAAQAAEAAQAQAAEAQAAEAQGTETKANIPPVADPAVQHDAPSRDAANQTPGPVASTPGAEKSAPTPQSASLKAARATAPDPEQTPDPAVVEGKGKARKGGRRKRKAPPVGAAAVPAPAAAAPKIAAPKAPGPDGTGAVAAPAALAARRSDAPRNALPPTAPDQSAAVQPRPIAAREATTSGGGGNPLARLAALRQPAKAAPSAALATAAAGAALATTPAVPAQGALNTGIDPRDERERMTVFGARQQQRVGGKPRFLGLMLTSALLLFLAGVAAWASVFLEDGLARFFRSDAPTTAIASLPEIESTPVVLEEPAPQSSSSESATAPAEDLPVVPDVTTAIMQELTAPEPEEADDVQLAALETDQLASDLPSAAQPAAPALSVPIVPRALTPEEAAATYAATGYWLRAPGAPRTPPIDAVDQIYVASIDPGIQIFDAVALPDPTAMSQEPPLYEPGLPPPAGLTFDIDERGVVRATPEGALTPDGLRVYAGLPPVVPPLRGAVAAPDAPEAGPVAVDPLSTFRPLARPVDIIEQRERATLRGISRQELEAFRPEVRPLTAQEEAIAEQPDARATSLAVRDSLVPVGRPRDMASIVERTEAERPTQPIQTAAVAPQAIQPSLPSATSVAQAATVRNAINLNKISLIGVYGTPANRRALVRLASGKYLKVKVGDELDSGRVDAIGEDDLRYTKRGRNVTLKMPRG